MVKKSVETPPPEKPEIPRGPLTPKPGVLALAMLLVGVMAFNAWLDGQPGSYDGKYLTVACAALIAGILGVDLGRFWKGGGS